MSFAESITQPTLLVDITRVKRNIGRMAEKAARSGVRFRPHFKTHQSAFVGELYRQAGVSAICVSSVDMAEYFADHGWSDITLLVPVNWLQIERINALAARTQLGLHVESVATAEYLAARITQPVGVWVEIDTGRKRTGVWWEDRALVLEIGAALRRSPLLSLRGVLAFAGQSYGAKSSAEIEAVYRSTQSILASLRDSLVSAGFGPVEISVGDTPTCSVVDPLYGVDEIRPGTMVYYDVMQHLIGACKEEDIAIAMACPVIAKYPERRELVIYGGAVHLSRDSVQLADGTTCFGFVTTFNETSWHPATEGCFVRELSQEIGIVRASESFMNQMSIGDVIAVLPAHVCLAMNEMGQFTTLDGETHFMMHREP